MFEWIQEAKDLDALRRWGDEPKDRAEDYLVRSPDYSVVYGEEQVAVLAVPVTVWGLHSFASHDYQEGSQAAVRVHGRSVDSVSISPRRLMISCTVEEDGDGSVIRFVPPGPGHYVIQLNGDMSAPLTLSFQKECVKPENVTKYFAAGLHMLDYMDLEDGDTVYLEPGAVLRALAPGADEKPVIEKDWAGKKGYRPFIRGTGGKHIRLCGGGIVDLSGLDWHERSHLFLSECEDVTIEGVTFVGAPAWTIHLDCCTNVRIRDVRMYGHRENSDGIDICSCEDVEVWDCFIRTGDDAVCLKAMRLPPVVGGRDVRIHDCVIWNDKVRCLGIIAEIRSDVTDVTFRDCDIVNSIAAWTKELGTLCVIVCDEGTVSDVLFENIWIEHERKYAVNCMIVKDRWSVQENPGHIRDIVFRNIHAPQGGPMNFMGYDADHKVKDILLENCLSGGWKIRSGSSLLERNEFVENIAVR